MASFHNQINQSQFEKLYALVNLMDEANQDQVVSNTDDSSQIEVDQKVFGKTNNTGEDDLNTFFYVLTMIFFCCIRFSNIRKICQQAK